MIRSFYTVFCDGVGCVQWCVGTQDSRTVREARRKARALGWTTRKFDLCPDCAAEWKSRGPFPGSTEEPEHSASTEHSPCEVCDGTGVVKCWSPGGPCRPENDPDCDLCGKCRTCAPSFQFRADGANPTWADGHMPGGVT